MKHLILSVCGLLYGLLPLQSYSAPELDTELAWKNTGLKLSSLVDDLAPGCLNRLEPFEGCIAALNVIASSFEPAGIISINPPEGNDRMLIGKARKDLALGLTLFDLKTSPKLHSLDEELLLRNRFLSHQHDLLKDQFNPIKSTPNALAEIRSVFESLITLIPEARLASLQSAIAGKAYDAYLGEIFDPHTQILPYQALLDLMNHPNEESIGIGSHLRFLPHRNHPKLVIESLVQDGPAMRAGIKLNDEIIAVDGNPVSESSPSVTLDRFTGKDGSPISLSVLRKRKKLEFHFNRGPYLKKSLDSKILHHFQNPIGFIHYQKDFFNSSSDLDIEAIIRGFENAGVKGIILDLRGNAGGPVEMAVKISSLFLGKKTVVSEKTIHPEITRALHLPAEEIMTGESDAVTDLPLVVLIDGESASASEIVAGALQDHQRAWLVGDRTFGKGSVQVGIPFIGVHREFNFDSPIIQLQTLYRFFQPSNRTNQLSGIIPDFRVPLYPGAKSDAEAALREETAFLNPLPSVGAPWVQPRPLEVNAVQECLRKHHHAKSGLQSASDIYRQEVKQDPVLRPDFRAITAEEILSCMIGN
jgi:carboxyl-terminal processing protease